MPTLKRPIHIALLGLGNVGQGVLDIIRDNQSMLQARTQHPILISHVLVRDLEKHQGKDLAGAELSTDYNSILNDPKVDIVVEVMGGEDPAYFWICDALKKGKHVVTANKEVIAKYKTELTALAKEHNVDLYFEASVGGGIPIIRSFKVGYAANQIQSIYGILNGTTNYILTKIAEDEISFEQALKEAQDAGFAEADPTNDVDGIDAAYKLVILAAVAFKADIQLEDITLEGIRSISLSDVKHAEEMGYVIKLIAKGEKEQDRYSFSVCPRLIPSTHPIANVRNEFNAIYTLGDALGEAMIYGKGAGSLPTGSAVVSDIIDSVFDSDSQQPSQRNLETALQDIHCSSLAESQSQFYLRFTVSDETGVLEKLSKVLSLHAISILKIRQKEAKAPGQAELVIITHKAKESDLEQALVELKQITQLIAIDAKIRVGL